MGNHTRPCACTLSRQEQWLFHCGLCHTLKLKLLRVESRPSLIKWNINALPDLPMELPLPREGLSLERCCPLPPTGEGFPLVLYCPPLRHLQEGRGFPLVLYCPPLRR